MAYKLKLPTHIFPVTHYLPPFLLPSRLSPNFLIFFHPLSIPSHFSPYSSPVFPCCLLPVGVVVTLSKVVSLLSALLVTFNH